MTDEAEFEIIEAVVHLKDGGIRCHGRGTIEFDADYVLITESERDFIIYSHLYPTGSVNYVNVWQEEDWEDASD